MDTSKILAFRHHSQAELLLESLLRSQDQMPEHAHQITDRSDLPSALQKIARQAQKQKAMWGAWGKDHAVWFFTAEVISTQPGRLRRPALKISGYNAKGKLTTSGVWDYAPARGWRRSAL